MQAFDKFIVSQLQGKINSTTKLFVRVRNEGDGCKKAYTKGWNVLENDQLAYGYSCTGLKIMVEEGREFKDGEKGFGLGIIPSLVFYDIDTAEEIADIKEVFQSSNVAYFMEPSKHGAHFVFAKPAHWIGSGTGKNTGVAGHNIEVYFGKTSGGLLARQMATAPYKDFDYPESAIVVWLPEGEPDYEKFESYIDTTKLAVFKGHQKQKGLAAKASSISESKLIQSTAVSNNGTVAAGEDNDFVEITGFNPKPMNIRKWINGNSERWEKLGEGSGRNQELLQALYRFVTLGNIWEDYKLQEKAIEINKLFAVPLPAAEVEDLVQRTKNKYGYQMRAVMLGSSDYWLKVAKNPVQSFVHTLSNAYGGQILNNGQHSAGFHYYEIEGYFKTKDGNRITSVTDLVGAIMPQSEWLKLRKNPEYYEQIKKAFSVPCVSSLFTSWRHVVCSNGDVICFTEHGTAVPKKTPLAVFSVIPADQWSLPKIDRCTGIDSELFKGILESTSNLTPNEVVAEAGTRVPLLADMWKRHYYHEDAEQERLLHIATLLILANGVLPIANAKQRFLPAVCGNGYDGKTSLFYDTLEQLGLGAKLDVIMDSNFQDDNRVYQGYSCALLQDCFSMDTETKIVKNLPAENILKSVGEGANYNLRIKGKPAFEVGMSLLLILNGNIPVNEEDNSEVSRWYRVSVQNSLRAVEGGMFFDDHNQEVVPAIINDLETSNKLVAYSCAYVNALARSGWRGAYPRPDYISTIKDRGLVQEFLSEFMAPPSRGKLVKVSATELGDYLLYWYGRKYDCLSGYDMEQAFRTDKQLQGLGISLENLSDHVPKAKGYFHNYTISVNSRELFSKLNYYASGKGLKKLETGTLTKRVNLRCASYQGNYGQGAKTLKAVEIYVNPNCELMRWSLLMVADIDKALCLEATDAVEAGMRLCDAAIPPEPWKHQQDNSGCRENRTNVSVNGNSGSVQTNQRYKLNAYGGKDLNPEWLTQELRELQTKELNSDGYELRELQWMNEHACLVLQDGCSLETILQLREALKLAIDQRKS